MFVILSLQLTGNPFPQLGLGSTLAGSDTHLLDKLDLVVTDLGFNEYTTDKRLSGLNMFAYTLALMLGTAGLPHVIIRFFTVPRVRDARSSAGWALVFIAILYTTAPAVGGMARLNLIQTVSPVSDENLVYEERPQWFRNWEKTGLLEFQDKDGNGRINYVADPAENELVTVDPAIIVLANPEIPKLPNWVIALVAAGGLAAALSTAAGRLLAIAGMLAGIGVTLFYVFQHMGIMFVASTAFLGDMPANWFLGIEPNAFGAVGALVNFGVAFAVSAFTRAPPESVRELVENIRVPAGAEKAVEH